MHYNFKVTVIQPIIFPDNRTMIHQDDIDLAVTLVYSKCPNFTVVHDIIKCSCYFAHPPAEDTYSSLSGAATLSLTEL